MALVLDKLKIPVSEINPDEFATFIAERKESLKECEADVKDAKRRISAAKSGNKKRKAKATQDDDNDDDDFSDDA